MSSKLTRNLTRIDMKQGAELGISKYSERIDGHTSTTLQSNSTIETVSVMRFVVPSEAVPANSIPIIIDVIDRRTKHRRCIRAKPLDNSQTHYIRRTREA